MIYTLKYTLPHTELK